MQQQPHRQEEHELPAEKEEQHFAVTLQVVRRLLRIPQAWILLAVLVITMLTILVQDGLLVPFLVLLFIGGVAFFLPSYQPGNRSTPNQGVLPIQKERLTEGDSKRGGFLARIQTLDDILLLTPRQFEELVAHLMEQLGYTQVHVVGRSRDLGVDIEAIGPTGVKVVVQCKRYRARRNIGSYAMQAFYGMVEHHRADKGMYFTTSSYTGDARKLAREHQIELVDGNGLLKIINDLTFDESSRGRIWRVR